MVRGVLRERRISASFWRVFGIAAHLLAWACILPILYVWGQSGNPVPDNWTQLKTLERVASWGG